MSRSLSFPYEVDYNDHFETPLVAYEDILPLLDLVAPPYRPSDEKRSEQREMVASSSSVVSSASDLCCARRSGSRKRRKRRKKGVAEAPAADIKDASGGSDNSKTTQRESAAHAVESSLMSSAAPIAPLSHAAGIPMEQKGGQHPPSKRKHHTLYDPYYCDGKAKRLLHTLGFYNVRHEKRDFYRDVENGTIPTHDTFVTNPPYSGHHKERCIDFAIQNLRRWGKSFFLLMPNYVALKEYYRQAVTIDGSSAEPNDIVYVVPPTPYEYEHPEGTGHDVPPFTSIWFCGIGGTSMTQERAKDAILRRYHYSSSSSSSSGRSSAARRRQPPRVATSIEELQKMGAVPVFKRPNPKQRRKMKKKRLLQREREELLSLNGGGGRNDSQPGGGGRNNNNSQPCDVELNVRGENDALSSESVVTTSHHHHNVDNNRKKKKKLRKRKSICRNSDGGRKRKKF